MIDIELARKFMLEFLPADAQLPVSEIFENLKTHPMMILHNGFVFTNMQYLKTAEPEKATICTNGILLGFALACCMDNRDVKETLVKYLAQESRARGENVVNFLHTKRK